jgi:hypothetical protein
MLCTATWAQTLVGDSQDRLQRRFAPDIAHRCHSQSREATWELTSILNK